MPLPQVPLTGVPIDDRSGGRSGAAVCGVASAGLRMILTVSQPSPTVVLSGRVCWASRAGASVTVAPGGGVKANSAGSCGPNVRAR